MNNRVIKSISSSIEFPSIHEPSALDNKTRLQEYHYHDLKSCCQQVETSLYIANKLQPKLTFCVLKQGLTGRGRGQKFIGELGDTLCKMVLLPIGASQICEPFPAEEDKERKTLEMFGKFLSYHLTGTLQMGELD